MASVSLISQDVDFSPKVVESTDPPTEVIAKPILGSLALSTTKPLPQAGLQFSAPVSPTIIRDDFYVHQKSEKQFTFARSLY